MEIVRFDCSSNNSPAYSCNKPGNQSGEYVRKEVADAMRFLIMDLHAAFRAINVIPITKQIEEVRNAIGI